MVSENERLIEDYYVDYMAHLRLRNYALMTISAYGDTVLRFARHFPAVPLRTMTSKHVERFLAARNVSPRSTEVELEKLRAFFKYLTKHEHLLRRNPCDRVERPRWQPRQRPAPTRAEAEAVCAACQTPEERAFVETFYFTGLRMRELLSVRVRDVDLGARRIRVVGKGGHERTVVFPPRVAEILAPRLEAGPDAWAFRPRDTHAINRMLARLGRDAGLPYHLTAHILRHAYFRLLKTEGVPLEVAARLGGHRSIKTTAQIYGALDTDDLQNAYDRHIGGVAGNGQGRQDSGSAGHVGAGQERSRGSGRIAAGAR